MGPLRTGLIRYALLRIAGLVATLVAAALILSLCLSGPQAPPLGVFAQSLIGDFGRAVSIDLPAATLIAERLAVSLPLALLATLVALVIGMPLGILAARKPGSIGAGVLSALSRSGLALPAFWLGVLLVAILAGQLRLVPPGGFIPWHQDAAGALISLSLPALSVGLPLAAIVARATARRFAHLDQSPAVFASRLRGATRREAVAHVGFPIVATALIGLLGTLFGTALVSAVIVENVFYLPGLGRLLFAAIAERDLAVVRGALLTLVLLAALGRVLADVTVATIDKRVAEEPSA